MHNHDISAPLHVIEIIDADCCCLPTAQGYVYSEYGDLNKIAYIIVISN